MSTVAAVTPFDDRSRRRRFVKIGAWFLGIALFFGLLQLLGVDIRGWLSEFWDALKEISAKYVVAGLALQTVQTTLIAFGWWQILKFGYREAVIPYRAILAAYAAGVSINNFVPASLGTLVSLLMYTALVAGATFTGVLGATVVQKIFFTLSGTFVYLYLFLSVPGSFTLEFGWISEHRAVTLLLIAGGVVLVVLLCRVFWQRLKGLWEQAKEGGAILARPRDYFLRVALPSFVAWCSKLGVIGVFLAAYGIPVTFHTIMSVAGGNSISSTISVTPGGAGVTQAVNVAALSDVTSTETAAAYSVGQQLILTMWNLVFAVAVVTWAFGWKGGKTLVGESYTEAKQKAADQRVQRAAKKEAEKAEEGAEGEHGLRGRLHRHPPGDASADEAEP
ncbi:MAG: lysylphosphatidylglycerol synthase transmembrane domain-containing protein [Gaiellaceae bacterium]